MRSLKGDTLVEVMMAIGIFSLVAISVVAVMNGGVSSSQTALETTLAREEIDTQAEALRFIQTSYIAEKDANVTSGVYEEIWRKIARKVVNVSRLNTEKKAKFAQVTSENSPATCKTLYENEYFKNNAFIINSRKFASEGVDDIIIESDSNKLTETTLYPRLLFGWDNSLLADGAEDLNRAEGIYVIAATDSETEIIEKSGGAIDAKTEESAYYDFYIRTCWYGTGDEFPTTIATTVRLYNPRVITTIAGDEAKSVTPVTVSYELNGGTGDVPASTVIRVGESSVLASGDGFSREGYKFAGWSPTPDGEPVSSRYKPASNSGSNITLYAVWKATVTVTANGPANFCIDSDCYNLTKNVAKTLELKNGHTYAIRVTGKKGYTFSRWSSSAGRVVDSMKSSTTYEAAGAGNLQINLSVMYMQDLTLQQCRNLATDANYVVVDRRDDHAYNIRYSSNQCWMTSDLAIGGVVLSNDSNFTTPSSVNLDTGIPGVAGTPYASYGRYNYCAARAGNSDSCSARQKDLENSGDICPAGWKLPTMSDMQNIRKDRNIFTLSDSGQWWTSTTLGPPDDGGSFLQCVLGRVGDEFQFDEYVSSCKKNGSSKFWGYYRVHPGNNFQIRCVHQ